MLFVKIHLGKWIIYNLSHAPCFAVAQLAYQFNPFSSMWWLGINMKWVMGCSTELYEPQYTIIHCFEQLNMHITLTFSNKCDNYENDGLSKSFPLGYGSSLVSSHEPQSNLRCSSCKAIPEKLMMVKDQQQKTVKCRLSFATLVRNSFSNTGAPVLHMVPESLGEDREQMEQIILFHKDWQDDCQLLRYAVIKILWNACQLKSNIKVTALGECQRTSSQSCKWKLSHPNLRDLL